MDAAVDVVDAAGTRDDAVGTAVGYGVLISAAEMSYKYDNALYRWTWGAAGES